MVGSCPEKLSRVTPCLFMFRTTCSGFGMVSLKKSGSSPKKVHHCSKMPKSMSLFFSALHTLNDVASYISCQGSEAGANKLMIPDS